MRDKEISAEDLEYVAELLRAISFFKREIDGVSVETLEDLDAGLNVAEAALRRTIAEIGSGEIIRLNKS